MKALTLSVRLAAEKPVCWFLASGAASFSVFILLFCLLTSLPLCGRQRRVTCAVGSALPVQKLSGDADATFASRLLLASERTLTLTLT